jgi:flagellar basal body-associated protein FliL
MSKMKIQGSKKNALIVLVVFISVLAIVLAIIVYSNFAKKYPEKPILMKTWVKQNKILTYHHWR